jgi:tetratricopeptide (TPR) repeat protein
MTSRSRVVLGLLLILGQASVALAHEPARVLAARALYECEQGRRASDRSIRLSHFEQGEALAEQALSSNDNLADAHFALFCAVGEQLRIDGEQLGSLIGFRRVMRELDRTLELDPDHLEALSSKGTLLVRLPKLLGGDVEKGEEMLHKVIRRDPQAINARLALAKIYVSRGKSREALALAMEALDYALAQRRADLIPEAQAMVASLRVAK